MGPRPNFLIFALLYFSKSVPRIHVTACLFILKFKLFVVAKSYLSTLVRHFARVLCESKGYYIARNLKRNYKINRFVPINSIVIYEPTMFDYNEHCQTSTRFYTTKTTHTVTDFNEKYIHFRQRTLRLGTKCQRFLDKEKSATRQTFIHFTPKLVQR